MRFESLNGDMRKPPTLVTTTTPVLLGLFALFVLISLFSRTPAYAQTGAGEIWGHVADQSGQTVDHATVTVTSVDTGTARRLSTDDSGRFAASALPAGRYEVTALHDGFAGRRQEDIVLLPGERLAIEMRLRRAPLPETIALSPYPPNMESTRTHAGAIVGETELEEFPLLGRRYLRLAELTPAVTVDAATGGLSVMDLPASQSRVVIDGFDHTSSLTGEPEGREGPARVLYPLSPSMVQAFRIHTNGSPAEIGRAGGAVISVVTRAGGNKLRGSGYEFFGDRALNQEKELDHASGLGMPPYRSNQFGAVLGGPIVRDSNFFLLSYDGLRRTDSSSASPNTTLFAPIDSPALQRLQSVLAKDTRDQRQDLILARTDHGFAGQHLMLRYVDQDFRGRPLDTTGMQPAISSTGAASLRNRSGAAALSSAIGGAVVNEARVQYADNRDMEDPSTTPAVVVWQGGSLVGQTGSSLFGPHDFASRRLQVADEVSVVAGGHALKAGGDLLRDRNATQFRGTSTSIFQTIGGFSTGVPNGSGESVAQTVDLRGTAIDERVDRYSAFLQDAWRATPSLTLDLGVRYDLQLFDGGGPAADAQVAAAGFGSAIETDRTNWAPRVGMAWAPGDRKHVFRAAYGLFYGATPAMIPALAQAFNGVNAQSVTMPPAGGAARTSIAVIDPNFRSARVQQASAGWETDKYRIGTLGVQYLFARGERLSRPVDINVGGRFPNVDRVVSFQSSGASLYNGVTLNERARVFQLFYTIAYTFSKGDETPQEPLGMIFGGLNGRRVLGIGGQSLDTRAPGDNDRRHRVAASAMYDTSLWAAQHKGVTKMLFANWEISTRYTLQSGQPYSAYVDGDINADGNAFNDLAPGTTRNQYRMPWQASIDPRVSRQFHVGGARMLSLIWQAFNATGRPNYTAVDNTFYAVSGAGLAPNPLFGRTAAQTDQLTMQIAATFSF
jgi:hypothetical protein